MSTSATGEEIRRAYLRQARLLHPDVGGDDWPVQVLNEAWAVLGDPERLRAYDRTLVGRRPPPPGPTSESGPRAGEDVYFGEEPEPTVPTEVRREVLLLVPLAVLGLAVACFRLSVVMSSVALQITAVLLVPVAALCFVMVPILTLRQSRRGGPTGVAVRERAGSGRASTAPPT
ncbi:MAG TPA: J domain-containing protein, partial [Acidimicrobiales bacterium]